MHRNGAHESNWSFQSTKDSEMINRDAYLKVWGFLFSFLVTFKLFFFQKCRFCSIEWQNCHDVKWKSADVEGSGHGINEIIQTQRVNIFLVKLRKTTENQDIRCSCGERSPGGPYQPLKHVIKTRFYVRDSK